MAEMFSDIIPHPKMKNLQKSHPSEWLSLGISPFSIHKMQCCGLRELYSTPFTTYFSKDSFFKWLWWNLVGEEGDRDWILASSKGNPRTGMLLLVLGGNGVDIYSIDPHDKREWALEMGFKPLGDFQNWVHGGRKLTLYGFQVPKDLSQWKSISIKEWKREKEKEEKECA